MALSHHDHHRRRAERAARRAERHAEAHVVRRGGRPRSETAEKAIIEATLDLISTVGIGSLSIEQVALKAGVGKATIYRRWPNKEALIVDAAASVKPPYPVLPGTSVRDDLIVILEGIQSEQTTKRSRKIYSCLMTEAQRHPELAAQFQKTVIEPRREFLRDVLRRGIATGELRSDIHIDTMMLMITGPILYYSMAGDFYTHHAPEGLARQLVDAALEGLAPRD